MKKEARQKDRAFERDCFLSLHQKGAWAAVAALTAAVALALWRFAPERWVSYAVIGSAFLILLLYRWISAAPQRALQAWSTRTREGGIKEKQAMLHYLLALEKALPEARKKEMLYALTGWKAALLSELNRKDEALSLLRGFHHYWDPAQKAHFAEMISLLQEPSAPEERKE